MTPSGHLDTESCYRAVQSRDRRFDGVFYTAVRTTGIYCRPSCPARTPASRNVTLPPHGGRAQAAGFRACKRCLPDATPGSPEWDVAADVAGRAMRLIADGVVDREGVDGLAAPGRLHPAPPQPAAHRRARCRAAGPGPRPSRADRAGADRDHRPAVTDVAFAAGFASVRQFNDTVREVYAASPTELRGRRGAPPRRRARARGHAAGRPHAVRRPRAARLPRLPPRPGRRGRRRPAGTPAPSTCPHGPGTVRLALADLPDAGGDRLRRAPSSGSPTCATPPRPSSAYAACSTPTATRWPSTTHLAADPRARRRSCAPRPGLRVPGQVDGDEIAVRTVIGQQVSVAGARTVGGRLVAAHGRPVDRRVPGLTHLFPDAADAWPASTPSTLPMPRARGRALVGLARRPADGEVVARPRRRPRRRTRARCWRCPASGRGPPTTSPCGRSATPTSSCPPTSAVRARCAGLARPGRAEPDADALAAVALLRPDAPVEHPEPAGPRPPDAPRRRRPDMWTVMPSPIGDLRIVERDGSIVAIEFSPVPPARRRPPARRTRRRRARAGRGDRAS